MDEKQYQLNENITIEKLEQAGFKKHNSNKNELTYFKVLYKEIELFITLNITNYPTIFFDENENVEVIDDTIGQYFIPFYRNFDNEYVRICKDHYHQIMMNLVNLGVLKIKEKDKTIIK